MNEKKQKDEVDPVEEMIAYVKGKTYDGDEPEGSVRIEVAAIMSRMVPRQRFWWDTDLDSLSPNGFRNLMVDYVAGHTGQYISIVGRQKLKQEVEAIMIGHSMVVSGPSIFALKSEVMGLRQDLKRREAGLLVSREENNGLKQKVFESQRAQAKVQKYFKAHQRKVEAAERQKQKASKG